MTMTPYTNQTAFDKAGVALLKQNAVSLQDDGDTCAYKTSEGLKCAIGHLIPDKLYKEVTEGLGVLEMLNLAPSIAPLFADCSDQFLVDLQTAHDNAISPERLAATLLVLAADWNLDPTVVCEHIAKGD